VIGQVGAGETVAKPHAGSWLGYQPALDGLRGIAVLAVLLFHAGFGWAEGGWLGVSTFFTLSGFLITSLLLHDRLGDPPVPLHEFWARRARRLLPASWLTLAGVLVFGLTVADAIQLVNLRGDVFSALFYVANWHFISAGASYADLFRSPSPVLHFWSLAIEEQFYLFYPLLLTGLLALVARRRGRNQLLAGVLTLGAATSTAWLAWLATHGAEFDRMYYGTDTRMAELLTGAALAAWMQGRPHVPNRRVQRIIRPAGLLALVALVALYATTALNEQWLFRGGLQVIAILGAIVVVSALQPGSPARRLLKIEPLRRLGLISYGVYLIHWPIYLWLDTLGWSSWEVFLGGGTITVLLALLSYRWVEQPVRRRRALLGPSRVVVPSLALMGLIGATLVVTADPPADPLALLDRAEAEGIAPVPTTAIPDIPGVDRPLRLLVVGDRSTQPIADTLAAGDANLEVRSAIARCGSSLEAVSSEPGATTCGGWADAWGQAVDEFDPDVTLVMPARWTLGEVLAAGGPRAPSEDDPDAQTWVRERVAAGFDVLASGGGAVAVAEYPHRRAPGLFPAVPPTVRDMLIVLHDVAVSHPHASLVATSEELPTTGVPGWLDGVARVVTPPILDLGAARADDAMRVMVVGDSVSWFVGRGLERWARENHGLLVWNTGTLGCGVARGGDLILSNGPTPVEPVCNDWEARWRAQLDDFKPDVVVMLTGLWDLADRRLPTWDGFHHVGEPVADEYLVDEYVKATDLLSESGASVVWLNAPCYADRILPGPLANTNALRPERTQWFDDEVLPRFAAADPDVTLVDLAGFVCPDGVFTQEFGGLKGVRPDGVHFSDDASALIASWLVPQLEAAAGGP
jgi:peptidoglycan/LPS O-acetylase OafA/YrhL